MCTLGITALDLGAEYAQITNLNLEIHGFGFALRVLPYLESASTLKVYGDSCMSFLGLSTGIGQHTLGYGVILKDAYVNSEHLYEPFP